MPRSHHRQANGLKILKASDPRMRRLKRAGHEAEIHGHKVWNSAFLVMKHLKKHPLRRGARVLEIGCGWGLLGQFCAQRFGARVHGTDADANVLPYLELHAEVNGVTMTAERKTFEQLRKTDLADWDLIVGTDVCFWDELGAQLWKLIGRARRAGAKQVIIADPGRPPFHELADRCESKLPDVRRIEMTISRPVKGSGELLIVSGG